MFVVCVTIKVRSDMVEEFIEATYANCRGTRKEPGNLRFDFCQSEEEPARFFLYEVYKAPEDFKRHQETTHYLQWKETVSDWMAEPRVGVKYQSLFPADGDW
jgi:autoinducer 2-degrading protein